MRIMKAWVVGAALALSGVGCNKAASETSAEMAASVAKLTVEQLADRLKSEAPPSVFDANGSSTREKFGTIPGATLLESSSGYDVSALPKSQDADLVFYCANTRCGAAEGAAKRAVEAGYKKVSVLPQGISGWVEAGQPTNPI